MANPVLVTYGIRSFNGKRKTVVFRFPEGTVADDISATLDALAQALDGAVDGKVEDATITLPITLPGGLKADPVDGNTVREGMLLTFDAAGTTRSYSIYIPSASNDNFVGDTVDTGVTTTAALVNLIEDSTSTEPNQTDEFNNDLVSFIGGERTFRK